MEMDDRETTAPAEAPGALTAEDDRLAAMLRDAEAENARLRQAASDAAWIRAAAATDIARLRAAAAVDRLRLEAEEQAGRAHEVEVRGLIMSLLDANEEIARLKAQVRHLIDQRNHARSRMGWVIREARNYKRRIDFDMHLRMSPPPGGAAPPADRGDAEDAH